MKKSVKTILNTLIFMVLFTIFHSYSIEENQASEKKTTPHPVATEKQVVALLDALIKRNTDFSVQIARPELPIKVALWQRKGQIQLPQGITWELFKNAVYQFGVDLYTLLQQDENGQYYHIKDIQNNPALYGTLSAFNTQIMEVKQKENGTTSIIKGVGKQLIPLMNIYIHAFYQQKLIEQIKGFLVKFEERAKKLRSAEQEAQKRAEQRIASFTDFDIDYSFPEISYESQYEAPEYTLPADLEALEAREEASPGIEIPEMKFEDIDWGF